MRQVVAAVEASDVTELELVNADFSVRVRREPIEPSAISSTEETGTADGQLHQVLAPFTGVFYRSPTPSARPYVVEGEWVDAETIIGLVETMKIFNEVTTDVAGRVVKFAVESGQLVHAGGELATIEPGERTPAESEALRNV